MHPECVVDNILAVSWRKHFNHKDTKGTKKDYFFDTDFADYTELYLSMQSVKSVPDQLIK